MAALNRSDDASSNSITPQGDGNLKYPFDRSLPLPKFKFHYPARGRKRCHREVDPRGSGKCSNSITPQGDGNVSPEDCQVLRTVKVQIPLPRKGTETREHAATLTHAVCQSSNSITPQGDGNTTPHNSNIAAKKFKFHYPARGRKLQMKMQTLTQKNSVQIPLPRKGTETHGSSRGLTMSTRFKFHYPARGRKLGMSSSKARTIPFGSNSITPQGDGNYLMQLRAE